jgi:hypothetical protein
MIEVDKEYEASSGGGTFTWSTPMHKKGAERSANEKTGSKKGWTSPSDAG